MGWKNLFKWLWESPSKEIEQKTAEKSDGHKKDGRKKDVTQDKTKKKSRPEKPVHENAKIQSIAKEEKSIQVIIGLDFGTAFTKVVISGAGQRYGIPLNENKNDKKQGTDKYLLPTRLYEDSEGNYFVEPINDVSSYTEHTDLKMRILDKNLDVNAKDRIIAYIAWVLKKSRDWLVTEQQSVFGGSKLKWEVNIGLPTERYSNEDLCEIYKELVKKAWDMSIKPSECTLHPDLINAFPEFAAQVQSYISSPQRKSGIHTLVDVGAGTIDATVFIVHKEDGENKHPILAESVKPLGTTYLADYRCKTLGNNDWRPSPYDSFPSLKEFSRKLRKSPKKIENEDKEFRGKVINEQINPILEKAKDDHDHGYNIKDDTPACRAAKEEEVPLMLCGGGARVKFYKEVVNTLMEPNYGYLLDKINLPILNKLDAPSLSEEDHNRLSVAYGLSFDALNIGETNHPEPLPTESTVQGKKTTCPLCGGGGGGYGNCHKCGGSGLL